VAKLHVTQTFQRFQNKTGCPLFQSYATALAPVFQQTCECGVRGWAAQQLDVEQLNRMRRCTGNSARNKGRVATLL
jgi:hypothetical protein